MVRVRATFRVSNKNNKIILLRYLLIITMVLGSIEVAFTLSPIKSLKWKCAALLAKLTIGNA